MLIAELLLSALVYLFVFVINWEDWIFGIKIAGFSAGLYLLLKCLAAALLLALILKYPQHNNRTVILTIVYYGFLFLDSSTTIAKNTCGVMPVSLLFAMLLLIPVSLIILQYHQNFSS